MNKRSIFFLFSILLYFFTSCGTDESEHNIYYQPDNAAIFQDSVTFYPGGQAVFQLDSMSSMTSYSVSMFTTADKKRLLSMISPLENGLNVYDYDTKKLVHKTPVYKEGPNGVGKSNSWLSHCMISPDSFLLCNGYNYKLFIINKNGEVLKKINIMDTLIYANYEAIPQGGTEKPIYIVNGKAYILCTLNGPGVIDHTRVKMVLEVDLKTGVINRRLRRSAVYNTGYWGKNYLLFNLFGTYNPYKNKFVYSFSADPFVIESGTDQDTAVKTHFVGSKYFTTIEPLSYNRRKKSTSSESEIYDFTTPGYYKIIYDPYARLYYRSSFLPITRTEYKDPRIRYNRQETIIIFNEDFRKVGEYMVPRNRYVFNNFFVTKEGLHILLKPELHTSEDVMIYEILKPAKKQQ